MILEKNRNDSEQILFVSRCFRKFDAQQFICLHVRLDINTATRNRQIPLPTPNTHKITDHPKCMMPILFPRSPFHYLSLPLSLFCTLASCSLSLSLALSVRPSPSSSLFCMPSLPLCLYLSVFLPLSPSLSLSFVSFSHSFFVSLCLRPFCRVNSVTNLPLFTPRLPSPSLVLFILFLFLLLLISSTPLLSLLPCLLLPSSPSSSLLPPHDYFHIISTRCLLHPNMCQGHNNDGDNESNNGKDNGHGGDDDDDDDDDDMAIMMKMITYTTQV